MNSDSERHSSGGNKERRPGFSEDQKSNIEEIAERKQSIQLEFQARKMSTQIEETIPEVAVDTPGTAAGTPRPGVAERSSYTNGKVALNASPLSNPDKVVFSAEDKNAKLLPADPTSKSAVSEGGALKSSAATTPMPAKTVESPKSRNIEKPASSKAVVEPKVKPVSKARTSTSSIGPPPKKETPQKPRSPTVPVKLPSSLTAPTASSRHKEPAARQSLAPSNGTHAAANKVASKSPIRTARPSINEKRERPSLGRPSIGPAAKAAPKPKEVKPADEGFLARMMRPTTASKSKIHDKTEAPVTRSPTENRVSVAKNHKKLADVVHRPKSEANSERPKSAGTVKSQLSGPNADESLQLTKEATSSKSEQGTANKSPKAKETTPVKDAAKAKIETSPKHENVTLQAEREDVSPQAEAAAAASPLKPNATTEQSGPDAKHEVLPERDVNVPKLKEHEAKENKTVEAEAETQQEPTTKAAEELIHPNAAAPSEEKKAEIEEAMMPIPSIEPQEVKEIKEEEAAAEKVNETKKENEQSLIDKVKEAAESGSQQVGNKLEELKGDLGKETDRVAEEEKVDRLLDRVEVEEKL